MASIEDLYTLAAKGERTIQFNSERDAVRFRLRMYKEKTKKANLFWPEITILLRGNTLVMGPKGFDIPTMLDDETLKALAEIDEENEQRLMQEHLRLQEERKQAKKLLPTKAEIEKLIREGVKKKEEQSQSSDAPIAYGDMAGDPNDPLKDT